MKSLIAAALMLGAMALPATAQERLSVALDWTPGGLLDAERLRERMTPRPRQLDLFG